MAKHDEAVEYWKRAVDALALAQVGVKIAPDGAANRAYYAVFHAASALFAMEGRFFTRHSAVESAVHSELVHKGRWDKELGALYTDLHKLRNIGDYGDVRHVSSQEASDAIDAAIRFLLAVHDIYPDLFPFEK
ncbi:MAG TPA: HEPN domain-containing protein [bacterium]|nr:HEPN domain-containing protein [bacterium]